MTDLAHKDFTKAERDELEEKNQAMPGGRFPIRNRADLQNAIQAYGRANNKAAVKAWIIKRAKALGLTDLLPDGWVEGEAAQSAFVDKFLSHYGVKGMKWGVRKKRSANEDFLRTAGLRGRKPSELSTSQLRELNERMNLEQNYSRMNPTTIQRGQARVATILAVGTTANAAIAFSRSPAGQAIASRIRSK